MKYVDTKVVFQEIPEEITLAINISGCQIQCPDCHSKYLWQDEGEPLDKDSLYHLVNNNKGITCVSFMGGDSNTDYLQELFSYVKKEFPLLKIAWYSGRNYIEEQHFKYLDYIKVGPYIKERGPLDNPNTNQRLYKVFHIDNNDKIFIVDITNKFWKSVKDSK